MRNWMQPALVALMLLIVPVVTLAQPTPPPPVEVPPAEETPEISPTEEAVEVVDSIDLLLAARLDLELLADLMIGGERPEGWTSAIDPTNPDLPLLVRLDLELLAGTLLGPALRPEGWFGPIASTPYAIARDIRHDLELLVDVMQVDRPANWTSSEPLLRCDRATQALVMLLEQGGVFTLQADRTDPDFCASAALEAATFTEINLLANPSSDGFVGAAAQSGEPQVTGEAAVAYFDLAGTVPAGSIPQGERLELVARSTGSRLMLVRGIGFELFVDYEQTNVPSDTFEALPGAGTLRVAPRCEADWCG